MNRVVVIGGGFAGAKIARALEDDFEVILFDTKNYFEFTPSILRTLVEPEHARKIQVFHKDYLERATFYCELVLEVSKNEVKSERRSIPYDYLVIASGSSYSRPFKEQNVILANRADHIKETHERIEKAKEILVIGGGLVGVEIAGELAQHYPYITVKLAHSRKRLMQRQPERASDYALSWLKRRGVQVYVNARVTQKGTIFKVRDDLLRPDLIFSSTGITCHSEFMKKEFSNRLNKRGQVEVNEFLQCEENIFVAGDITAIDEEKTAQNAEKQADIVINNIKALERGKDLEKYESKERPMVISLGKWNGLLTYKNFVLSGIIPGILKELIEWKTMRQYR